MSSIAYKIENYIKNATNGYILSDAMVNELDYYSSIFDQLKIYPYIWYNAKYSSQSNSGTPANATSTSVFNLGTVARDVFEFEKLNASINSIYDSLNETVATASTATGLLDVTTISTDRPLFDLTSSKTIATNQTQANGHFTFAISLTLATTTNQTLLTSANTGGVEITTDGSSKVVFAQKSGASVTFDTAITTSNKSLIISWDSFSGQAILYIDGKKVSASDEQTLLLSFNQENLTIGALAGTAQNIMIINDFLEWDKARDLAYLISYQHNILTMPQIIFTPSKRVPFTAETRNNLASNASYPVSLTSTQYRQLQDNSQTLNSNGGLPLVWYNPEYTNKNLWLDASGSDDVSAATYTIDLGIGTYSVWFGDGTGTIISTNNTGVASKQCSVSLKGQALSDTIVVTTAGTFNFAVTGNPKFVQIERGSVATVYQARKDNVATKVFNLGTNRSVGDGVFSGTKGTTAYMLDVVNNKFTFSGDNFIQTNTTSGAEMTMITKFVADNVSTERIIIGVGVGGGVALRITSTNKLQVVLTNVANITGGTGTNNYLVGTEYKVALTRNSSGNYRIYTNFGGSFTTEVSTTDAAAITNGSYALARKIGASSSLVGSLSKTKFYNRVLTATQIENIFNDI